MSDTVDPITEETPQEQETAAEDAGVKKNRSVSDTEAPAVEEAGHGIGRSVGKQSGERNWYVIHTYSGFEDQVAEALRQRIQTLGMQDKIYDVLVPTERQVEMRNGKRRTVVKKIYPGYVMVDMVVTDDSWYVVRNTPNVTGFIGFGVRPTPLSPQEVHDITRRMEVEEPTFEVDLRLGDLVRIEDGALKGFEGKILEVDEKKGKVKVQVSMFGRETPVTLDYLQIKKV